MLCSLGDAFSVHNGSRFQTSDSDHNNCSVSLGGGGWWFPEADGCGESYLTGTGNYSEGNTNHSTQMYWTGKGGRIYLKEVTMKFRDKDFSTGNGNCVFRLIKCVVQIVLVTNRVGFSQLYPIMRSLYCKNRHSSSETRTDGRTVSVEPGFIQGVRW